MRGALRGRMRTVTMTTSAYDRVKRWLEHPAKEIIATSDIEWLMREVEAVREYRGNFAVAHARYMRAGERQALAEEKVKELEGVLEETRRGSDYPLWRKIANQRREIRSLIAQSNMYQRLWLKEKEKNNAS